MPRPRQPPRSDRPDRGPQGARGAAVLLPWASRGRRPLPATRRAFLLAGALGLSLVTSSRSEGGATRMAKIALLGDSTLDNAAYVTAGKAVVEQLRRRLPPGSEATLLAVDGDIIRGVTQQLARLPPGSSHLVVSVGGNDALGHSGVLAEGARSVAEVLDRLAAIRDSFAADYRAMLDAVLARNLPTTICTIYDPAFPDSDRQRIAATALAVLNDVITREAASRGLPLIDLRVIFSRPIDYANAIEPSAEGGRKFAAAIVSVVVEHDFASRRAALFAGPV